MPGRHKPLPPSTTILSISGTEYHPNLISAILSTNATGQVVATTSVGFNFISGTLGVSQGGTASTTLGGILTGNGTGAVTSATINGPLTFAGNALSINQANSGQNGFLSSTDWTTFNSKVSSTSLSGSYPIQYNSSTGAFTLAYGTTTANSWSSLQTFNGGASTTNITASGEGYFATASTTNLIVSGFGTSTFNGSITIQNLNVAGSATSTHANGIKLAAGCFSVNGSCITNGSGVSLSNSNTWTALQLFSAGASTTNFSNFGTAYFGGTATSSFNSAGALSLVSNGLTVGTNQLLVSNGKVGIGTTSPYALFSVSGGDTRLKETTDSQTALVVENAAGTSTLQVSTLDSSQNLFEIATSTGTAFLDVTSSGNIGFGSTTPAATFGLVGSQYLTGGLGIGLVNSAAGTVQTSGNILVGGNLGIGTTTPTWSMTIASSTGAQLALVDGSSADNAWTQRAIANNFYIATSSFSSTSSVAALSINGVTGAFTFSSGATSTFSGGLQTAALNVTGAATSTSQSGFNIATGCFSINGTCITGGGGGSGTVNSGTTGQLPFYAANGTTLTATSSVFLSQAGNLGIGTTTPGSILSVQGVANWTGATSTFYSTGGINLAAGCFAINGTCLSTGGGVSLSASNSWTGLQQFSGGASSSNESIFGTAYFGGTATTTINNSGISLPTTGAAYQIGGTTVLSATSTTGNTLVGLQAGNAIISTSTSVTSGNGDTALGYQTLLYATSSSYNVAIGYEAMRGALSTSGDSAQNGTNVAIGWESLSQLTSGSGDVGIGSQTLTANSTGSSNLAIGTQSQQSNTTGSSNIGVGVNTLFNNGTGSSNVGIGLSALFGSQGSNNTAIGYSSGPGHNFSAYTNQGGTYVGFQTGYNLQTGSDYNTLFGYQAGNQITTGAGNIIVGAASTTNNDNLTTGYGNIKIGNNISLPSATASGQLDIGNLIYGTGLGSIGSAISTGNVGIGTTTPYARLEVWGPDNAASTTAFSVVNNASSTELAVLDNGNATLAGNLIQNSDQRLKTNVESLDASSSLSAIDALNPVTFNWIDANKGPAPQLGFIAQQVLPIFPNLISTTSATALTPNGTLSLNYIGLISPIVSAIQALSSELATIENTIAGFADSLTTKELTFTRATGDEIDVNKLCVGSTCVTETQFKAMLAAANQTTSSSAPPPPSGDRTAASSSADSSATPPVLQVNGDNPAHIHVGDTYQDLGATITGPQADLNLGIKTFLNGTLASNIVLDTSSVATDTIDYVVTDQNGLISTSTRSVIVSAPQAPNDNQSSTTPANDNSAPLDATGTTATSTLQ